MPVPCPSCSHPLALLPDADTDGRDDLHSTIATVECPNCGHVPIANAGDRTATFVQRGLRESECVAHFRLVRPLGGGSFGTVWLARDENLQRDVALKLPHGHAPDLDGLLHEARVAATLQHPNIVSVHEVGRHDGQVFIASEFVDGLTLRDTLSTGKPSFRRTAEIVRAVGDALEHAHEKGVIHRDVKPANILMRKDGRPSITDFGLAKRLAADESISANGQILGTARYMAPEQAAGDTQATDHRSDIYALGVMLFEMVTGDLPFRGNMQAILHQKTLEEAPSPRTLEPSIPSDLETICVRCLAKDAHRRYQSGREVADELGRFLSGEPIHARAISKLERLWRWCRRRPAISSLIAALFLSLTTGLLAVSAFWLHAEDIAEQNRRALYRSRMNLASEYLARGDLPGLSSTLDHYKPDGDRPDLRGFEWHYHARQRSHFAAYWNQGAPVTGVAISRDGRLVATLGSQRSISVFHSGDGSIIQTLAADAGRFRSVAFSHVNNSLAAGSSDGVVRVWNAQPGASPQWPAEPRVKVKHGPPVARVAFTRDGRYLLSMSLRGAVRVWDARSGARYSEIPTGEGDSRDCGFAPDGESVAVAKADGRIRITSVEDGTVLSQFWSTADTQVLAWSPDSDQLATGAYDGTVRIWNVDDESQTLEVATGQGRIGGLRFVDSNRVALVGTAGHLLVLDTVNGDEVFRADTHNLSDGLLDLTTDATSLVVGSGDGSIKLIATKTFDSPTRLHHGSEVRHVALHKQGAELITAAGNGQVSVWNLDDGTRRSLNVPDGALRVCATPDEQPFIAIDTNTGVHVHDWKNDQQVASIGVPAGVSSICFTPSGDRLMIARRGGGASCYAAADWTNASFDVTELNSAINALAASPDGRYFAAACEDRTVQLLDGRTGEPLGQSFTTASVPTCVAYCRQGQTLAVGCASGELHLLSVDGLDQQHQLKAHTGRINALAAFSDTSTLVTAGRDRIVHLWDTQTGERLTTLYGHGRQVFDLDVDSETSVIASGDLSGRALIWRGR